MRKASAIALAWAGLIGLSSSAQAEGLLRRSCSEGRSQPACETCAAPKWVEKSVTCYRPEWHEREAKCTVNRMIPREVVTREKCTVWVPTFHDEKRTVTVYKQVPRQVERDVVTCKRVRVCEPPCEDCCDGCCRRPRVHREWVQEVHKVKCTVWDCILEQKEVTLKVCQYIPQEKSYDAHRIVYDIKPETIVRKERYCVMVPYQVKVKVPVCCQ